MSDDNELKYGQGDASFRAAGGYDGIKALVDQFYLEMGRLPEAKAIWAMHSHEDMALIHDKLTRFLCGWLGGPRLYREKYGPISVPAFHKQFPIGVAERNAWLLCMKTAADKQPFSESFKHYLLEQLYRPADFSRSKD